MQPFRRFTTATARWLGLLMVLSLVLSACAAPAAAPAAGEATAPAAEAAAPAIAGEVSRADTLIFAADTTDLITLDPAVTYEFSGIQGEGSFYETLVSFTPGQSGVQPLLAESWDVKDDGDMWTVTFKLNPEAKFASGNPVTADDVVWSWGRAIDINKSPAFLLIDVAKVAKENLTAVDPQTFQVKLPKTVSPQVFLAAITFTVAAVVEKAAVEANMGTDMGESWLNDYSAGSGPYVLNTWDREVSITMDANPNYWGEPARLPRVIIQNMKDATNRLAAIETGDADVVQDLGPEQRTALEGNPDVSLFDGLNTQMIYLGMNAKMAPFDNPDVREAVRYAINYDEIIALTGGGAKTVQEIIPDSFLGHTGLNPFTQDIAKAKELLAKAGVAEGIEIEMLLPSDYPAGPIDFPTLAAKLQSDLAQAGITLNLRSLQFSELLNIYRAQESPMTLVLWGPDYPDPDGNATPFTTYAAKSIAFRNGWDDAKAADMAAAAALAPTAEERTKLYADLTEYVFHQGPYAMLYQPTRTYAVRNTIDGFNYDASDTPSVNFALIGAK